MLAPMAVNSVEAVTTPGTTYCDLDDIKVSVSSQTACEFGSWGLLCDVILGPQVLWRYH